MSIKDQITPPTEKKLAIITGASSGIGLEFTYLVAETREEDILIIARREDRLLKVKKLLSKRFPKKNVFINTCDLSSDSERIELKKTISEFSDYQITLLVNNAGFGSYGEFKNFDSKRELKMIDLNCKAIIDLTSSVLPQMIKNNFGQIINVSSMAGFQGLPLLSTYAATKAFVTSFSLALAHEVSKFGISVQALCPGPVHTEFASVSGANGPISSTPALSARQVAELGLNRVNKGQVIVIPGLFNWILSQANRFLPRSFASKIAYAMLKNR